MAVPLQPLSVAVEICTEVWVLSTFHDAFTFFPLWERIPKINADPKPNQITFSD